MTRTVATVEATAATLVALLEHEPAGLGRNQLQHRLGVGPWAFGRALAIARLHAYVTIADGRVTLTEKAAAELAAGRARLEAST